MNNSRIVINNALADDPVVDNTPQLRQRETELRTILEAVANIRASDYWKTLEEKVFTRDVDRLTSKLRSEKDTVEMYRLQGQLAWAEKYTLEKLENQLRTELINLKNQFL